MNFEDWLREHFLDPHPLEEECLEEAFRSGYEAGVDYMKYN